MKEKCTPVNPVPFKALDCQSLQKKSWRKFENVKNNKDAIGINLII